MLQENDCGPPVATVKFSEWHTLRIVTSHWHSTTFKFMGGYLCIYAATPIELLLTRSHHSSNCHESRLVHNCYIHRYIVVDDQTKFLICSIMSTTNSTFDQSTSASTLSASNLNGTLLSVFCTGFYTCVYLTTMYIYLQSKMSKSWFIISIMTTLCILNILQMATQWYQLTLSTNPPMWLITFNDATLMFTCGLADLLLIWRCYRVWNNSFWVIFSPSILLVGETGVYLALMISDPGAYGATAANLLGAAATLTLGTTVLTTSLIVYRISSATRTGYEGAITNTRPFFRVVEIIIQSSALYVAISLVFAANELLIGSSNSATSLPLLVMIYYVGNVFPSLAGLAPTIMIARIAMSSNTAIDVHAQTLHACSSLQFQQFPLDDPEYGKRDYFNKISARRLTY